MRTLAGPWCGVPGQCPCTEAQQHRGPVPPIIVLGSEQARGCAGLSLGLVFYVLKTCGLFPGLIGHLFTCVEVCQAPCPVTDESSGLGVVEVE